jgi:hypothetical protein
MNANIGELAETFMKDYKAASSAIRSAKREYAIFEFYRWELIRDEIRKFDEQAEVDTND